MGKLDLDVSDSLKRGGGGGGWLIQPMLIVFRARGVVGKLDLDVSDSLKRGGGEVDSANVDSL